MTTQKQVFKEIYDALILTACASGISMLSNKLIKRPLGIPQNLEGVMKMGVAFGVSAALVKIMEDKKLLPENPLKAS